MFERFTEVARQVVVLAQEEADALGHNYIGTEHLLLGLLAEKEGLAGRILASFRLTGEEIRAHTSAVLGPARGRVDAGALATIGIDFDEVRRRVEETFGPGALERTRAGRKGCGYRTRPFTPRAKKVLELALREAVSLGDDHIGTEHVLLGLLREGEGLAVALLRRQGLSPDRIRAAVLAERRRPSGGRASA